MKCDHKAGLSLLSFLCIGSPCYSHGAEQSLDLRGLESRFVEQGVREERYYIRNSTEWRQFWHRFEKGNEPVVDFSSADIVVYLMGTVPSGGYSAKIESIEKTQRHLDADNVIHVLTCYPGQNQAQVSEVSAPYAVKVVPKRLGKILWKIRKEKATAKSCR